MEENLTKKLKTVEEHKNDAKIEFQNTIPIEERKKVKIRTLFDEYFVEGIDEDQDEEEKQMSDEEKQSPVKNRIKNNFWQHLKPNQMTDEEIKTLFNKMESEVEIIDKLLENKFTPSELKKMEKKRKIFEEDEIEEEN